MSDVEASHAQPIPLSEHSRVLIAMHKAMRADSERLIAAVDVLPSGDTAHAAALGRAFAAIVGLIHEHHWTKDDVMYPFLLERVSTFEDDAIRLENDHVELDAAMARINARFRLLGHQLSVRLWQDTRSHLLDEAVVFNRVLVDHLDREEDVACPRSSRCSPRPSSTHCIRRSRSFPPFGICAWLCLGCWPTPLRKRRPICEGSPPAARRHSRSGLGAAVCPAHGAAVRVDSGVKPPTSQRRAGRGGSVYELHAAIVPVEPRWRGSISTLLHCLIAHRNSAIFTAHQ